MVTWSRRALLSGVGAAALAQPLSATRGNAGLRPGPRSAVVLTIAGDTLHFNRGAADPKLDGFMNFHEITFERAFAFDRTMLAAFPQPQIRCQPPQYSAPVTFRGPSLKRVLREVGAEGAAIQTRALDGFAVDLSAEQIAAKDWILATEADGRPFGIGDKGPIWMMHTPSAIKVPEEEEQGWPWALFFIRTTK